MATEALVKIEVREWRHKSLYATPIKIHISIFRLRSDCRFEAKTEECQSGCNFIFSRPE